MSSDNLLQSNLPRCAADPMELIRVAVERGIEPEQLSRLMDLQERWQKHRAMEAFAAAMNLCQSEMPVVVKDATNSHTKGTYALLETIQRVAKPIYTKHGFSLSWGGADCPREGRERVVCRVRHSGGHVEEFQGDYPMDGTGAKGGANMNALQGKVSSNTYAQRDMMRQIFNITVAGHDDDGNGGETITPDQVAQINDLLTEKNVDVERFHTWLKESTGAERLDQIPSRCFLKVIDTLRSKKR